VTRDSVGDLLSSARIYLQHPCCQVPDTDYDKPHFLKLTGLPSSNRQHVDSRLASSITLGDSHLHVEANDSIAEVSKQDELRRTIGKVFESLTRSKKLNRIEADIRITRKLLP
jgi:SWI/SNF-related matrix-associated actin-dependent regulator of chromatin subfamily A3